MYAMFARQTRYVAPICASSASVRIARACLSSVSGSMFGFRWVITSFFTRASRASSAVCAAEKMVVSFYSVKGIPVENENASTCVQGISMS